MCRGQFNWPLERKTESVISKTPDKASLKGSNTSDDTGSSGSNGITDMVSLACIPFPQRVTNEHADDDNPTAKELADADDKSQASVGSNCSLVIMPAEEEKNG